MSVVSALGWLVIVYPDGTAPGSGNQVAIEVESDSELDAVSLRLARAGLIEQPWLWSLYAQALGAQGKLRVGTVMLTDDMTARQMLQRLARGFGSAEIRVMIPEGFNRFDIAARLERWGVCDADAFVVASADPALLATLEIDTTSVEGYLFPDTYVLRSDMPASKVMGRLVANARRRLLPLVDAESAALAGLRQELGWGLHEVLIMASIVEREAAVSSEQPTIAGVFLNRLRSGDFKPKRLQADPTVAYGCLGGRWAPVAPSCRSFDGRRVTRAMTADAANPYNTYRIEGLPPGPISNPGLGAIKAVLHPAEHGYFYFVASGAGRHTFSATLSEHNTAAAARRPK